MNKFHLIENVCCEFFRSHFPISAYEPCRFELSHVISITCMDLERCTHEKVHIFVQLQIKRILKNDSKHFSSYSTFTTS